MGMRWLLPAVILLCVVWSACSLPQSEQPEKTLRVEPVDLFQGEAKKFKPFLGDMSGGVKWRYTGEKKELRVTAEIWNNGSKKEDLGDVGGILLTGEKGKPLEGELVVSVRHLNRLLPSLTQANTTTYLVTVSLSTEKVVTSSTQMVQAPYEHQVWMDVQLHEPQEATDDDSINVWAMQATAGNSLYRLDLTPEILKRSAWLILFKIKVADE